MPSRPMYLIVRTYRRYQREPVELAVDLTPDLGGPLAEHDALERAIAVVARAIRDAGGTFSRATVTRYDGKRSRQLWSIKSRRAGLASVTPTP